MKAFFAWIVSLFSGHKAEAPVAAPTPSPGTTPPPVSTPTPPPPLQQGSRPWPRPTDLPAGNHFASSKQAVLAPEYRYLYSNGTLDPAYKNEQAKALKGTWGDIRNYYNIVGSQVGIPWWAVACLHHMECGADPRGGIANGQPWNQKTTIVPKGRGPFSSFVAEAVYSLEHYQLPEEWNVHFAGKNWTDPGWVFWFFNSWNGFIQATSDANQITPPYACSYIYNAYLLDGKPLFEKGRHVSDFNFDKEARSEQLGCMAFIRTLENSGEKIFP